MRRYMPLSVRHAPRWGRKRLRWRWLNLREDVAFMVAPWLRVLYQERVSEPPKEERDG